MNKTIGALGTLAFAATLVMGVAAKDASDVPLTLSGCVIPGDAKDSFLVTNVTVDGTTAAPANAFYRLDDSKKLRDHVGHRVEINGVADLDDHDKGKVTIKEKDGKVRTEITSERKTVKAEQPVWGGTIGSMKMKGDISTYGFEVKSVKRLEGNCANASAGMAVPK
jgi:hypothetical protein